jgi:predicted SprT family Zn-dependent metalloprotease
LHPLEIDAFSRRTQKPREGVSVDRTKQKSRSRRRGPDPTGDQFGAYRQAFDYFNRALFGDRLPRCILNFSRRGSVYGFFSPERWARGDDHTHEISLNPDLLHRPVLESMGTLVHEMVHELQHEFGKPSRRGYHNKEWADMMESIGLMPSNTGHPGGRRTGQRMSHYIIDGGPFDVAFRAMPPEYQLPWTSGQTPADRPPRADKVKYQCPMCAIAVWGKAGLHVVCEDCDERLQSGE